MFLTNDRSGYIGDEQFCRGWFLIICDDPDGGRELRACVRKVTLRQCGHWMMGRTTIGGKVFTLSGGYGSDGLPKNIRSHWVKDTDADDGERVEALTTEECREIWATLCPLPPGLRDAFWAGGGHNCPGKEGPQIRAWGRANLGALRRAGATP